MNNFFKKLKKPIIIIMFLVIIFYSIFNTLSIWNYAKDDETRSADVAIILGAATDGREVSSVFEERLNHGIWLYENGYVGNIILTGGYGEGNDRSDADIAKEYMVSQGILEEDILLEEKSTITEENLENAKIIMEQEGYDIALIVSDPLHMKRAMLMAKDYGIIAYSSPTQTSAYVTKKSQLPFLAREVFFYTGYQIVRIWR